MTLTPVILDVVLPETRRPGELRRALEEGLRHEAIEFGPADDLAMLVQRASALGPEAVFS